MAVSEGETVGLLGHAQAGKTTLLRILGKVSRPTGGRVIGCGHVVPMIRLGAAFESDRSGYENVFVNAEFYGLPRSLAERSVDSVFEFAGLEEFRDVPIGKYSSGMYLRFAFSVAVSLQPDILLADAVFGVGDLDFQERARSKIRDLASAGTAIVMVTHDTKMLLQLCDRVIWLHEGRILSEGLPDVVLKEYLRSPTVLAGDYVKRIVEGSDCNRYAQIDNVALQDEAGDVISDVNSGEPFRLVARCRLLDAEQMVRCVFKLFTAGKPSIQLEQREAVRVNSQGLLEVSVRIPPYMLAPTVYGVTTEIVLGERSTLTQADLSFEVHANGSDTPLAALAPFANVVEPRLEWTVKEEVERTGIE